MTTLSWRPLAVLAVILAFANALCTAAPAASAAGQTLEQSNDELLAARCTEEIAAIARVAEARYPKDPFLPETLYMELFGMREASDWTHLKAACERLMTQWPDYRMMWAIEDMYEKALEGLDGKPAS